MQSKLQKFLSKYLKKGGQTEDLEGRVWVGDSTLLFFDVCPEKKELFINALITEDWKEASQVITDLFYKNKLKRIRWFTHRRPEAFIQFLKKAEVGKWDVKVVKYVIEATPVRGKEGENGWVKDQN